MTVSTNVGLVDLYFDLPMKLYEVRWRDKLLADDVLTDLRPVLYISTPELRTVTISLTTFQNEYGAQWNLLLSGAVISVVPLLVIYIFAQRYVVEGIATTGIK